jgi:chemotaxis protein CheX
MPRRKPKAQRLQLAECLDFNAAAPLVQSLRAARGRDLIASAGDVRSAGAQCIQVLLSAVATWQADRASFRIVDASPALIASLKTLGIPPAALMIEDLPQ